MFSVIFISPTLKAQLTFTINNLSSSYSITCGNPTVNLVAISNFTTPVSYTWTNPQLTSTTANSLGITIPGIYTINASANNLSASQTLAIGINTTAPSITLTASQPSLTCLNPVSLLMGSSNSPNVSYKWVDGFPQDPMNPASNTYTAGVAPHTYTLIITDLNGCTSSATINISDNRIYFPMSNPQPFLVTCPDGTVSISPVIPANSNTANVVFSWTVPITATVTGANTGTSLVTNGPGVYKIMATDTLNGCKTIATVNVYACVGLNEYSEINFRIFPNPVEDKLHFEFGEVPTKKINLSIINTLGQTAYLKNNINLKGEVDMSFLKNGVYYLKFESDKGSWAFKILKE